MTLDYLFLQFDLGNITCSTEAFRSAFIQLIGFHTDNRLHNHLTDRSGVMFRYPLIQYKWINAKPCIIALGDAARLMYLYVPQFPPTFNLYGDDVRFKISQIQFQRFDLEMSETPDFVYEIKQYVPFNSDNYAKFKVLTRREDKKQFLSKLLNNHLLAMAKGLNWQLPLYLNQTSVLYGEDASKIITTNDHKVMSFSLCFQTQITLPDFVGIGKDTAKGMGVIKRTPLEDGHSVI